MSTRAPRLGLGWLAEMAGQVAAVAAVPVAIALALALKPPPEIELERRSEPLWHNTSHAQTCPACRLLSHQAESPAGPSPAETTLPEPIALPIDSAVGSAAMIRDGEAIPVVVPEISVL